MKDTRKKWRRKVVLLVKSEDRDAVNAECVALGWATTDIPFFNIECEGVWLASCPMTDEMLKDIPKKVKVIESVLNRGSAKGSGFVLAAAKKEGVKGIEDALHGRAARGNP